MNSFQWAVTLSFLCRHNCEGYHLNADSGKGMWREVRKQRNGTLCVCVC